MDDKLVEVAKELIKLYGYSLLEDPDRLGQLLEDRCGESRREIFVLSFALREVLKGGALPKRDAFARGMDRVATRLCENLGFSKRSAAWAVEAISQLLFALPEAEEGAESRIEAHRGFLPYIGNVMAKRPRTILFRQKALRNGLLLTSIIMIFLGLFVRITESRYNVSEEHGVLFLAHLSGPEAAFGHVRLKAAQLAADQINAAGGVKGRTIRIRGQDVPQSAEDAARVVDDLMRDKNNSVAISVCGDAVNEAIARIADAREMPLVVAESSVMPATMAEDDRPWLYSFRMNYDNIYRGRLAAYFLAQGLKRSRPALVCEAYSGSSYEMRGGFLEGVADFGGAIACEVVWTRLGDIDRASVDEIISSGADSVVLLNDTPGVGSVVEALRNFGYDGVIVGMSFDDSLTPAVGRLANSWWIIPAHPDDPQLQSFKSAYRDRYNENISRSDFAGTLFAYDSVHWAADAIFRAPGFQGEALRHSFMSTKNLALSHATLSIDPRTHGPWNKASSLVYCDAGGARFQRRFRPR
ncbi:MAG: ABC transporter substrate-binding protein [Synergistaceae bacterium]|jgi:branched-chain amino acid transport system substrate-binding protein|nr:ABC transporter substrate-binding protein [Synergistaceae bacterium]